MLRKSEKFNVLRLVFVRFLFFLNICVQSFNKVYLRFISQVFERLCYLWGGNYVFNLLELQTHSYEETIESRMVLSKSLNYLNSKETKIRVDQCS